MSINHKEQDKIRTCPLPFLHIFPLVFSITNKMIKEPQRVTQSPPCAQKNSLNNYTKQRNPSKRGKTIEIEDAQKKFSYNSSFFTQYNKKRRKTHHSTKSNATTWHSWKCIFHFFFWFFLLLGFLKNPKRKHKRK